MDHKREHLTPPTSKGHGSGLTTRREADANETSGELGLALPGNLVGESQLRIPMLEPDTMLSNIVPLESVELEYHDEW